jgi:hypothetical protein
MFFLEGRWREIRREGGGFVARDGGWAPLLEVALEGTEHRRDEEARHDTEAGVDRQSR